MAIVFGAILGASAAIGVALGWTEPYWVPEPILILVLYIIMGKRDRITGQGDRHRGRRRGRDTRRDHRAVRHCAHSGRHGRVHHRAHAGQAYWLMYGLYTFSFVLLLAAPGQVGFEAEERGVQILVGIGCSSSACSSSMPSALTREAQSTTPELRANSLIHVAISHARGLEGIVAKRRTGIYRPGHRGWTKVKNPGYWRRERRVRARAAEQRATGEPHIRLT